VTGGMRFAKTGIGGSFYVAQYVDPLVAKKIVSNRLSVNVNGYRDLAGTDVTVRVYLLIGTTDDNFPDLASNQTLGTIQDNGTFDVNATGWKEIPRSNLPTAQATLSVVSANNQISNKNNNYGFNGWKVTDSSDVTNIKNAAVVVTFWSSSESNFVINSISLTPGDLPVRPPEKSKEQVLQECRYFYETSYYPKITAGSPLRVINAPAFGFSDTANPFTTRYYPRSFSQIYKSSKIKSGNLSLYSTAGTENNVSAVLYLNSGTPSFTEDTNIGKWTVTQSLDGFSAQVSNYDPVGTGGGAPSGILPRIEGVTKYNYKLDARLGLVV
jgi:hypothetical protein